MGSQQCNLNNIEMLKAAGRQVIHDEKTLSRTRVSAAQKASAPRHTQANPASMGDVLSIQHTQEIQEIPSNAPPEEKSFIEAFFRRLQTLAHEEQMIKKEKEQFDKIWANLEEKRQKLDTRLVAINRVKGKLSALHKEIEDIIL